MLADFRFALRSLLRSPVFTLVSVLMLGAGIGLSIFMFSSINAFVLKPLPFPEPDQLVHFEYTDSHATSRNLALPALDWLDLRERQKALKSLAAYTVGTANLGGGDRLFTLAAKSECRSGGYRSQLAYQWQVDPHRWRDAA